eukprot:sb/3465023/
MAGVEITLDIILKGAKLLSYKNAFLENGADDAKQISELDMDTFGALLKSVGMDSKPFHVIRLIETLKVKFGTSPTFEMPNLPSKSEVAFAGNPDYVSSGTGDMVAKLPRRRRTKAHYAEVKLPDSDVFDELTDERSDDEQVRLVAELSAIYKSAPLNKYQICINSCAAELALRDLTLLARREDLLAKAKEANLRGGKYKFKRGFSTSKSAPRTDQDRPMGRANFDLANKRREKRLADIQRVEESVNKCQFEKEGLLERLRHETSRENSGAIASVRERLDELEEQIHMGKKRLNQLKHSQRRSEKYYSYKLLPKGDTEASVVDVLGDQRLLQHRVVLQPWSSYPSVPSMLYCNEPIAITNPDSHACGAFYAWIRHYASPAESPQKSRDHHNMDILTDVFINAIDSNNHDQEFNHELPNYDI